MTNLDFTSRVRNGLNTISKDDRKSRRYILHVGRQKAEFYISQKLGERSLHNDSNIYTTVECVELEPVDLVSCDILEFRRCKTLMRSKKKLPKLIYSRYGSSLKEVISVDGEYEFKATTPSQYRRDKERAGKSDYVYYYVKDDYLYILDEPIYLVSLYLITTETEKVESCDRCENCKSLWEYNFVVPDKLEEVVITETIKEVSMNRQLVLDENPDLNSNNKQ